MSSKRASTPVKLFIVVQALEEQRIEERLISDFGLVDHRHSLIPTNRTIHRVFLSFERLIETGTLARIKQQIQSLEKKFSAKLEMGFLENGRVVVVTTDDDAQVSESGGNASCEDLIRFKDGGVQFFPATDPDFQSINIQEFFLSMRKTYRGQLRSMCLLRR